MILYLEIYYYMTARGIYKTQKVFLYTHAHVRTVKHSSLFTVHNGRRRIVYIIYISQDCTHLELVSSVRSAGKCLLGVYCLNRLQMERKGCPRPRLFLTNVFLSQSSYKYIFYCLHFIFNFLFICIQQRKTIKT